MLHRRKGAISALLATLTCCTNVLCIDAADDMVQMNIQAELNQTGKSADTICDRAWAAALDWTGDDVTFLYTYGLLAVSAVTFWSVGSLYTYMDVVNRPVALRKYKIQPGTSEPLPLKTLVNLILVVLMNQTVSTWPVIFLAGCIIPLMDFPDVHILPSCYVVALHIVGCVIIEEIGFYYSHRLLHWKYLYKWFHKKHHEWTSPVAISAIYCHPVEHILSNVSPLFLGVLVLRVHILTAWLWLALASAYTLSDHSGYHLPFLPSTEFHDYHHYKFNNNYGVLGVLDYLHGTDVNFRKSVAYKRHHMLFTTKSARELHKHE